MKIKKIELILKRDFVICLIKLTCIWWNVSLNKLGHFVHHLIVLCKKDKQIVLDSIVISLVSNCQYNEGGFENDVEIKTPYNSNLCWWNNKNSVIQLSYIIHKII